jgi:antitoxin component YwqK of YwqJK toxin-antitoxin module
MNLVKVLSVLFALIAIFQGCKNDNSPKLEKKYIYFQNGHIRRSFHVKNGIREGEMLDFFPDGKLKTKRIMKAGLQVGRTEMYYPDGTLKEVQYFDEKGQKSGGDTLWYPNQKIEFASTFKQGKLNGFLIKYDTLGQVTFHAEFRMDSLLRVLVDPSSKIKK